MNSSTPLTISRGDFSAERLKRLTPEEQRLIVMAGHISNEITILQKILVACMNFRGRSAVAQEGFSTQNLVVAKVLGGKLLEAWQAIKRLYYGSQLSRRLGPELMEESRTAEADLKRYFRRENLLHKVRNGAAFHYSGDAVPQAIASLPDELPMQIYLAEETGNSLYSFAEQPMFMEAFAEPANRSLQANFDEFIGDTQRVGRDMAVFLQGCIGVLWERLATDVSLREEEVPRQDVGGLHDTYLPFFLKG
jgi:hypothetical protein